MTTDAKVGLLLGLVFIVIIAFLINGLPDFLKASDGSELVRASASGFQGRSVIIGEQAQRAVEDVPSGVLLRVSEPPKDTHVVHVFESNKSTLVPSETEVPTPWSEETKAGVRTYIVQPGDNLGKIAPKVYGTELGNKVATVEKIILANKQNLKSPDDIVPGQKLVIPPLSSVQVLDESVFPDSMFERVKNAFTRKDKPTSRQYVVQDGDSLWQIAERVLGDGNRYKEIVELNTNVITDADDLSVGMHLKLPSS